MHSVSPCSLVSIVLAVVPAVQIEMDSNKTGAFGAAWRDGDKIPWQMAHKGDVNAEQPGVILESDSMRPVHILWTV